MCVSSSATGQCSTPFGTTNISPGPSVTSPPRIRIVSRPLRTRKKSSVSGCECQTNSPFTLTTMRSWPLNWPTVRGWKVSVKVESLSARLMASMALFQQGSQVVQLVEQMPDVPPGALLAVRMQIRERRIAAIALEGGWRFPFDDDHHGARLEFPHDGLAKAPQGHHAPAVGLNLPGRSLRVGEVLRLRRDVEEIQGV